MKNDRESIASVADEMTASDFLMSNVIKRAVESRGHVFGFMFICIFEYGLSVATLSRCAET